MAALQFVEVPGYSAIILRRSATDLTKSKGLVPRADEWLGGTGAHWNGKTSTWTFPSGATLSFGGIKDEKDKYDYRSAEFHYIAFDELTSFTETQYTYLMSRLRRTKDSFVPIRVRSASNPGDIGHYWVRDRFVKPANPHPQRRFIPSWINDNPSLDSSEYIDTLGGLDSTTNRQLVEGNWDDYGVDAEWPAEYFGPHIWFDDWPHPAQILLKVISLDPSKGKESKVTTDSRLGDYSAYTIIYLHRDGTLYIDADADQRRDTTQIVQDGLELYNIHRPDAFGCETDVWQSLLAKEFVRAARAMSPPILLPIFGVPTGGVNKKVRIRRLGPLLAGKDGRCRFKANSKGAKLLVEQLRDFPIHKYDDLPDSCEMSVRLLMDLMAQGKGKLRPVG